MKRTCRGLNLKREGDALVREHQALAEAQVKREAEALARERATAG